MSAETKPMYVKAPFEIRYGGGLLVPGDLVPAELVEHVPEGALTGEPPPPQPAEGDAPSGPKGGTGGATGDTGSTGDAGSTGSDEPEVE